jgi:hypothetical protein
VARLELTVGGFGLSPAQRQVGGRGQMAQERGLP